MTTLIESVRDQILAGTVDVPAFLLSAPEEPDVLALVTPYEGEVSPDLPISGEKVQIKCRAPAYGDASTLAWQIFNLVAVDPPPIADRKIFSVTPLQSPVYLGSDEQGRFVFGFNLQYMTLWKDVE